MNSQAPDVVEAAAVSASLAGGRPRGDGRTCVLVVAHSASAQIFGAERSLLDLLDGFQAIGIDVVAVVPPGIVDNPMYRDAVAERVAEVVIERVPYRKVGEPADGELVDRYCSLLQHHDLSAVHTNTVVPREPLLAARRCGVPAVVHARELPHGDEHLCHWLGGTADDIVASVLSDADYIVANSLATARTFARSGRTFVVPNAFDPEAFPQLDPGGSPVRVALIGSVTAKKGVHLFRDVAELLAPVTDARFIVVGPSSEITEEWKASGLPPNLELRGYLPDSGAAMAEADVVVSMSTVAESFGRTIVEAMASGLPVVAFAAGGVVEHVVDGRSGLLVPPGDLDAFAAAVLRLCTDSVLRRSMGSVARSSVHERYRPEALASALAEAYRTILPSPEVIQAARDDVRVLLPSENRTRHAHPFFVGARARFAHCTDVAFVDDRRLVTASLLGQRLYLVDLEGDVSGPRIVAEVPTIGDAGPTSVDLLDSNASGQVVTADCDHSSLTLYQVSGANIRHVRSITVPGGGFCHGVAFVPGRRDLVAVAMTTCDVGIHFVSLADGVVVRSVRRDGWIPKSLAFAGSRRLVAGWVRANVGDKPGFHHDAQLTEIRLDRRFSTFTFAVANDAAGLAPWSSPISNRRAAMSG